MFYLISTEYWDTDVMNQTKRLPFSSGDIGFTSSLKEAKKNAEELCYQECTDSVFIYQFKDGECLCIAEGSHPAVIPLEWDGIQSQIVSLAPPNKTGLIVSTKFAWTA